MKSGTQHNTPDRKFSNDDLENAFKNVSEIFGADVARTVEKMYRKETANFTSGQFKKTFSAGMEISSKVAEKGEPFVFPYGWSSLEKFLTKYPQYNGTFYTVTFIKGENKTGKTKTFIGFPTLESAIAFLAYRIDALNKAGKHAGYWRSTVPEVADRYFGTLKAFKTTFT